MVDVANHPNITLHTYSEVENVDGYIGNFQVTIRKKARSVDMDKCTGCGVCMAKCPQKKIPNAFDKNLGMRPAIYVPFPQAVPNTPVIDRENCTWFKSGKCGVCQKVCGPGAVDYTQEDQLIVENRSAPSSSPPASSSTTSAKSRRARPSRATANSATARSPTSSTA